MADAMKLLPCPMCGGEAVLLDYEARYGGLHYASRCPQCTSCGCSMGYLPTAKKAVEAWNCRASPPAREEAQACPHEAYETDSAGQPVRCSDCEEAPAEGAGERVKSAAELQDELDRLADEYGDLLTEVEALRNRTSEPEAGAVAWRVRWKPLERSQPGAWREPMSERPKDEDFVGYEIQPLFDHPAPAPADKLKVAKEAPTYHDLFITTASIPRTSIFNLPFAIQVHCARTSGWQVWEVGGGHERMIAGEYADDGLRLDVGGHVICDSLSKVEEPGA